MPAEQRRICGLGRGPDSRHVHKNRTSYTDGFKVHVSVETDTGLTVATALTAGNAADGPTGVALLADEIGPVEVLADSAYGAGEVRAALDDAGHTQTIKPTPLRPSTDAPDAFTIEDFTIDLAARTATCPAGNTVPISPSGAANFGTRGDGCPMRARCTRVRRGNKIKVHPHHNQLARARRDATGPHWQHRYRRHRPMVERSIAWLVTRGHRRVAYHGIDRNRLWLAHRATAVDLKRLVVLGLDHDGNRCTLSAPA